MLYHIVGETILDLKIEMSKETNVKLENMLVADIFNNKVHKKYKVTRDCEAVSAENGTIQEYNSRLRSSLSG
jgi:hypothetical protein